MDQGKFCDEESVTPQVPLPSAKRAKIDFARGSAARDTEATELEEEEEGAVNAKMKELSSERVGGSLCSGRENRSPGKLFGRGSSPASAVLHSQRTTKALETKERAQVLHEMAQTIYAKFSVRPPTPLLRDSEQPAKKSPKAVPYEEQHSPTTPVPALQKCEKGAGSTPLKREEIGVNTEDRWNPPGTEVSGGELKSKCADMEAVEGRCKEALAALQTKLESLSTAAENREKELESARKEAKQRSEEADLYRRKEADLQVLVSAVENRLSTLEIETREQRFALTEMKAVMEANRQLQKEVGELKLCLAKEIATRKSTMDELSRYSSQVSDLRFALCSLQGCETPLRPSNKASTPHARRTFRPKDTISSPFSDAENNPESQPLECPKPIQEPVRFSAEDDARDAEYHRLLSEKQKVRIYSALAAT